MARPPAQSQLARQAADAAWEGLTRQASATASVGGIAGPAYEGASAQGTWFSRWPTGLGSADRDYLPNRRNIVGRTRDVFRNEVGASAIVARRKNAAVGRGWRLSSKPSARALGLQPTEARELGQQIETEWKLYAYGHNFSIDAERRLNFGQLLRVAASHLMMDGEFLAVVEYAPDEPTRYKTRLRIVDPDRLSTPMGQMDSATLVAGVERNTVGVPVRYWIRERHPNDVGVSSRGFTWKAWERFSTPLGRPQVLHGFDPDRAGQTRGVSRFAACLKSFRALSRFTDATLQSATINALIVGYMQSSAGPEAVSENLSVKDLVDFEGQRETFYGEHPVEMGEAVLPAVPFGDELKLATASKDVGSFDAFFRSIYRLICASLGVTYEEGSMDYSQTNYSSARAAMLHAWAETQAFMAVLEAQLVKPFFVAWLEEAFDEGYIAPANDNSPDFYAAVDAYAEARWIGPARGYVDPVKEILAAAARIEAGISTLEDECADQGKEYEEVLAQTAFEQQMRRDLGLETEAASLGQADQDTKDPFRDTIDKRPPAAAQRSALRQVAEIANSPEHEASLDARPVAA